MKRRRRKKGSLVGKLLIISLLAFTAIGVVLALSPEDQMARLARLEARNAGEPVESQGSGGILQGLASPEEDEFPDWVDVQFIDVDGTSRRGEKLEAVRDIVVHYVGNPGTTAQQNRDYFDNDDSDVSAHFVVGLDGEVIQCIPMTEKSSATNERNKDTISIEVCHPDGSGEFTAATYDSVVRLAAWLCDLTGLSEKHVIRHYDVTGKLCPLYYVENEVAWSKFLKDVKEAN